MIRLRLREWRERRGLSIRRLASLAAVGFATIYRIEAGKISPTVELLRKLAKPLRISIKSFIPSEARPRKEKSMKLARSGSRGVFWRPNARGTQELRGAAGRRERGD